MQEYTKLYIPYWEKRYDNTRLPSLENKSSAPKNKQEADYSREVVCAVRGTYGTPTEPIPRGEEDTPHTPAHQGARP